MTENKTVRKLVNKAVDLYEKGEWNKAIKILDKAMSFYCRNKITSGQATEILLHLGWNYWKKGDKEASAGLWRSVIGNNQNDATDVTKASAHAGLSIYYAEKGDKEKALHHAKLAQELLPADATLNQVMNLNACGISLAKIGELGRAEEILRKVAQTNEQLEKSENPVTAKKAKHQRAKNGYNLASLVYIPQKKWREAIKELNNEVAPRYVKVGAETDLAAAYHRLSEVHESIGRPDIYEAPKLNYALELEERSLNLWRKHPDDPKRIETAEKNIQRIKEKIAKLKQ